MQFKCIIKVVQTWKDDFFTDLNNKPLIINHCTCGYKYLFTLKYFYVVQTFHFNQITNGLPTAASCTCTSVDGFIHVQKVYLHIFIQVLQCNHCNMSQEKWNPHMLWGHVGVTSSFSLLCLHFKADLFRLVQACLLNKLFFYFSWVHVNMMNQTSCGLNTTHRDTPASHRIGVCIWPVALTNCKMLFLSQGSGTRHSHIMLLKNRQRQPQW